MKTSLVKNLIFTDTDSCFIQYKMFLCSTGFCNSAMQTLVLKHILLKKKYAPICAIMA